jgi:hypothetical protein
MEVGRRTRRREDSGGVGPVEEDVEGDTEERRSLSCRQLAIQLALLGLDGTDLSRGSEKD